MLSKIGIGRVTGVLLIAFIPAFLLSTLVINSVDTYEREFREVFEDIAHDPTQLRVGVAFTMAASLLSVVVGGALFLTLSPHHRALALFGALGFHGPSVLLMVAGVSGMAMDQMAGEFNKALSVSAATGVTDSARPLAFMIESALFPALIVTLPLGLIAFGALIVRTGAAPLWLGWLVVTVSPVMTASFLLSSLVDVFWFVGMISAMALLFWFALTGGWMLIRGARDVAAPSSSREPAGHPQPAL